MLHTSPLEQNLRSPVVSKDCTSATRVKNYYVLVFIHSSSMDISYGHMTQFTLATDKQNPLMYELMTEATYSMFFFFSRLYNFIY
jgi:hypothetical protein